MSLKKVVDNCCGPQKSPEPPDHSSEISRINRIKGQLDGIKRMIEERRYCPDIITQTSAVRAAIASLEASILEKHLKACVRSAFNSPNKDADVKIQELIEIFKKAGN